VLHVVAVDELPSTRRGVLDHMAFWGADISATLSILKQHGIAYRLLRLPRPWSTWQVFFHDPNGAEVEIDFDAAQRVPPELKDGSVAA
jgi:catechol 2,3-dioxygenase-like lactoylglutathione lyase family enzyme